MEGESASIDSRVGTRPFQCFIPKARYYRGIRVIESFMRPYIEQALALPPSQLEKLSKSDKNATFLHNIARYSRDPQVLRDQIMAILLAGRDTTAATLSWAIYELAHYPAIYAKLRNQVLSTVGESRAPTCKRLGANSTPLLSWCRVVRFSELMSNETLGIIPSQAISTSRAGSH